MFDKNIFAKNKIENYLSYLSNVGLTDFVIVLYLTETKLPQPLLQYNKFATLLTLAFKI